jgi:hypothetical protein
MPGGTALPSLGDVDRALARMPDVFRNRDFRDALGIHAWPASQMLSMLLTMGVVSHAGGVQLWRVEPSGQGKS